MQLFVVATPGPGGVKQKVEKPTSSADSSGQPLVAGEDETAHEERGGQRSPSHSNDDGFEQDDPTEAEGVTLVE
jgi:hypothetical protein